MAVEPPLGMMDTFWSWIARRVHNTVNVLNAAEDTP